MKIIIEFNGIKREIDGPFSICMSSKDVQSLKDAIRPLCDGSDGMTYGWVDVHEILPRKSNVPPKPWTDGSW